jgi:hypothetical protein
MSSALQGSATSSTDIDAVDFESQLQISPGRVQRLARKAIGAYHLVPEPTRDVQLALRCLGVADEVVFRKLEDRVLFLSPQPGVTVERFNDILVKLDKSVGDRSLLIRGGVVGLLCASLVVGMYLLVEAWR